MPARFLLVSPCMRWVGMWTWVWIPLLVGCAEDISPAATWACDGAADGSSWSRLLEGEPYGGVVDVATDCSGHIVTATLDGLTKLTPRGDVLWSSAHGSSHEQEAPRVAVAPNDSIVVLAGQLSPQLIRLDPDGAHLWTQPIDPGDSLSFNSYAFDVAIHGNIAVAAGFVGSFQIGPDRYGSKGDCSNVLVAMLDESGVHRWASSFGSRDACATVTSVTFDSDGHLLVTGHMTVGLSPDELSLELFLIKFDGADGQKLWLRQFTGPPLQVRTAGEVRFLNASAIDGDNDVLIAGWTNHSINLGAGLIETDADTSFVAKYAGEDGRLLWAQQLEGVFAYDVAVTPDGEVVALAGEDTNRSLLARYSPSGELLDTQPLGYDTRHLAIDPGGDVVAAGSFYIDSKLLPALVRVGADEPPVIP